MHIDFHSHILPGVDDGSPSVEVSVEMLHRSVQKGITHVVATPHFYADYDDPIRFLRRRERAQEALRTEMAKHEGLPTVLIGAETAFFRGISQSDFLPELTIQGKNCILIEMPPAPWPEEYFWELVAIRDRRNIIPIVAHIDRYIGPWCTFGIPKRLERLPVYVQANAEFFLERSTARMALRMLKTGQIHLLGSDCHNLSDRKPNLGPALEKIGQRLGEAVLQELRDQGRKLLDL